MSSSRHLHTSHWGAFEAEVEDGAVVAVHPHPDDPDPSPLLGNITASLRHRARIQRADGPRRLARPRAGTGRPPRAPSRSCRSAGRRPSTCCRGSSAASTTAHGGEAVYGGSYGWASAGRFHHAQSQLHRFLNCLGGFVRGEHSYSNGALTVIMPHVVGDMRGYLDRATAWSVIERHTELFVCFGGIPLKNTMVSPGGRAGIPSGTISAR